MAKVVLFIITLLALAFAYYVELRADAREKAAEKRAREAEENGAKLADKITEANEVKEDANSGNFDTDFNYMAGKLHEYAQKH